MQRQIACKFNHDSIWHACDTNYAENERTGHDRQVQIICVEVVNVRRDELVDELHVKAIVMSVVGQTGTNKGRRRIAYGYHDPSDIHQAAHLEGAFATAKVEVSEGLPRREYRRIGGTSSDRRAKRYSKG